MDKDKEDNLKVLQGGGSPNLNKEALEKAKASLDHMLEYIPIYTRMLRAKYEALLDQGFTEAQALELCKTLF